MAILTQSIINVGLNPDDGTGDSARNGFIKANTNFTSIFNSLAPNRQVISLPNTFQAGQAISVSGSSFVLTTPNVPHVGVIESATSTQFTIVYSGLLSYNTTPGANYYLSDTVAGSISTSASTNGRIVGIAQGSGQLLVLPYGAGGGTGQVLASSVAFAPTGTITSTNVQSALAQIDSTKPSIFNNIGTNAPVYSGQSGQALNFRTVTGTNGISVTYNATDVIVSGAGITGGVTSFNTRTGAIVPLTNDYTAAQIANVPYNGITQVDVQDAINGLDTRKLEFASNVGAQPGQLISGVVGTTLNMKTISVSGGLTLINGSNSITISGGSGNAALKVLVANQAARLALTTYPDLMIAYQADNGNVYAINGGSDPSVLGNWTLLANALGSGVNSFNTRTGNVVPVLGDYTASYITNVPSGGITQTDVQSALNSLDSKKVSNTVQVVGSQSITGGGALSSNATLTLVNDNVSPGNSYFYGTSSGGSKGWYSLTTAISSSPALSGFVPTTTQVVGSQSITGGGALSSNATLTLVGDSANPGNSQLYGTNSSGTKGWYKNTGAEDELSGQYEAPSVKVYKIKVRASYAGTINSFACSTSAGSATYSIQINGTGVGGLTALTASTTLSYTLATSGNTFNVGDQVQINVTAVSSCTDFCWTLGCTKT